MNSQHPAPHEVEISVFGPGLGECSVIHVGDGDWVIVDSCRDQATGRPVALDYLHALNVDIRNRVQMVVASHWHDDHINGLDELLCEAHNARFVNSAAHELGDIVRLTKLSAKAPLASATRTYEKILQILQARKLAGERRAAVGPVLAGANKTLLSLTSPGRLVPAEVCSLSPSDGVMHLAKQETATALAAVQQRRRPVRQQANQLCIVLMLRFTHFSALLGADLENTAGITEGWNAIIHSQERPKGTSAFFKIPHHGSNNADAAGCWTHLLSPNPIAVVTPYSCSRLPRKADIERICGNTSLAYITSEPANAGVPRRSNMVDKTLRNIVIDRRVLTTKMGQVRCRFDASSPHLKPLVEVYNGARNLP